MGKLTEVLDDQDRTLLRHALSAYLYRGDSGVMLDRDEVDRVKKINRVLGLNAKGEDK